MPMAMENLSIAQHWNTLWYAHTRGGNYKLKMRQFDVGDFVYLQRQPNDILDTSCSKTTIRRLYKISHLLLVPQNFSSVKFLQKPIFCPSSKNGCNKIGILYVVMGAIL
jgi:hypothetical protein